MEERERERIKETQAKGEEVTNSSGCKGVVPVKE